MRPTSLPKRSYLGTMSSYKRSRSIPKGIGCPKGTVPIRRATKADLINAKYLSQPYLGNIKDAEPGTHLAVARTLKTGQRYAGVEGSFNILKPNVGGSGWSSGQMWIYNGQFDEYNSIQAGWTVSPKLYNDDKAHSFLFWQGENNKDGCYNLLCPGFVQVDNEHPIGRVLPNSELDKDPLEISLSIHQDRKTKDWWLVNTQASINYGYWPKDLFPLLVNGTSLVAWGGMTKETDNQTSPPMGSGYFPEGKFKRAGYFYQMKIINATDYLEYYPNHYLMEKSIDAPKCYDVKDYGVIKDDGYTSMYGGPGGNCGS